MLHQTSASSGSPRSDRRSRLPTDVFRALAEDYSKVEIEQRGEVDGGQSSPSARKEGKYGPNDSGIHGKERQGVCSYFGLEQGHHPQPAPRICDSCRKVWYTHGVDNLCNASFSGRDNAVYLPVLGGKSIRHNSVGDIILQVG